MSAHPAHPVLPIEHRRAILQQAVAYHVSTFGAVVYQTDTYAVVDFTQRVNHTAHLLATLLLCGLWLPIWLIIAWTEKPNRRSVYVDEWGQVFVQQI